MSNIFENKPSKKIKQAVSILPNTILYPGGLIAHSPRRGVILILSNFQTFIQKYTLMLFAKVNDFLESRTLSGWPTSALEWQGFPTTQSDFFESK